MCCVQQIALELCSSMQPALRRNEVIMIGSNHCWRLHDVMIAPSTMVAAAEGWWLLLLLTDIHTLMLCNAMTLCFCIGRCI
jgi:hypothetical protein